MYTCRAGRMERYTYLTTYMSRKHTHRATEAKAVAYTVVLHNGHSKADLPNSWRIHVCEGIVHKTPRYASLPDPGWLYNNTNK